MCLMRLSSLYLCIHCIIGNAIDIDQVLTFPGCNATIQWILWDGIDTVTAKVWNPSGRKIVWIEDQKCQKQQDSSLECYTKKDGNVWVLYVVLINSTKAQSGLYTCEIKYKIKDKKNITRNLIITDKPQIRTPVKTIRGNPLNISCDISGKLDDVFFSWRLNGIYFNSTGRINVNSSVLIFDHFWMVDNSNVLSCEVCQENKCCMTSEPFSLNPHVSWTPESNEDVKPEFLGMLFVLAPIALAIIGVVKLQKMRFSKSAILVSHVSNRQFQEQEDREDMLRIEVNNRPLPLPTKPITPFRRANNSHNHFLYRKSKSLSKLDDWAQDMWNSYRQGLSLQTLNERSSNYDGSEGVESGSVKTVCLSIKNNATSISVWKIQVHNQKGKKESNVHLWTSAESFGTSDSINGRLELEPEEDLYCSIDENAMMVYDYARAAEHGANVENDLESSNTGNYEYDYARLPGP